MLVCIVATGKTSSRVTKLFLAILSTENFSLGRQLGLKKPQAIFNLGQGNEIQAVLTGGFTQRFNAVTERTAPIVVFGLHLVDRDRPVIGGCNAGA
jgi:hypothetical protein